MLHGRGGRGGAARPQVPTTEPSAPRAVSPTRRRVRSATLIGAVVAVAVAGTACGQYPNVRHQGVVRERVASATTSQPPSSPVSGAGTAPVADGATGPGPHPIRGGGGTSIDLSRIFPVHRRGGSATTSGSGSKQDPDPSGSSSGGAKGSSTGGSKGSGTGSTANGSSTGGPNPSSRPHGDDGAHPGRPDIKGHVTPGPLPTGSLDLAQLVSRETVQGGSTTRPCCRRGSPS